MTSVAIYHNSVPSRHNQEKIDILKNFSLGVKATGDVCFDVKDYNLVVSDVGVIQGWINGYSSQRHSSLRYAVVEQQLLKRRYVVAVDSNLFLYANANNPLHYLRYSFNGVFPNTGIYCDNVSNPDRWKKISKNLNISLKDYRTSGNHILLCLQRNGGWSMAGLDVQDWTNRIIHQLRQTTDRPIIIRAHPGDKSAKNYLLANSPECKINFDSSIKISTNTNLNDDLKNCWAAVNHNSSPVVGAAIEGIPIFVTDPQKSQCAEIANTDLSMIENPCMPDRQAWAERISMSHWNFDELRSGECWSHMRQYVKL